MRLVFAIGFASIIGLAVAVGAGISASAENFGAGKDASSPTAAPAPPGRVGRISLVSGKVGFRGPGEKAWSDAEINDPVARGVSVRTDPQARAELRIGSDTIDLAGATELAVADLREQVVEIAVRHGRIGLGIGRIGDGEKIEVDIARGGVWLLQPGQYDIADGDGDAPSRVAAFAGRARFFGGGSEVTADAGTAALLGPGSPGAIGERVAPDAFSQWCRGRAVDETRLVAAYFVSPAISGLAALDAAGTWKDAAGYGEVWVPRASPADWAPYRDGHWRWVAPWGWTWIDDDAWGFAPSHYGRWAFVGQHWAWVPGGYAAHPVWAPATVAFLGTPGVGLSFAEGTGPAVAWFPLAPGEVYWPNYTDDLGYIRKLNSRYRRYRDHWIRADGEPPAAITNGDYANRIFASVVPRPVFVAGRRSPRRCCSCRVSGCATRPALMGSPQIGPSAPAVAARSRPRAGPPNPTSAPSAGRADAAHVGGRARPGPERCAPPSSARASISTGPAAFGGSAGAGLCRRVEAALYDRAAGGACRPGPAPRRNPKGRNPKESDQAMIDYRSDNTGRAAPEILEALVRANRDTALGYGGDQWTAALQQRFSELFETAVRVFPVATGTAANALGLAALGPSWGIVYCGEGAHINTAEANAAGFSAAAQAGAGCREHGRVDAGRLAETLAEAMPWQLHYGRLAAVSLTQASDLGTVYSIDEIGAVAEIAKSHGLKLHMDGARFANAVARLGCRPAEATWRCGVDIMSFGATKNGGALCDAIVVFDRRSPTGWRCSCAEPGRCGRRCGSPRPS